MRKLQCSRRLVIALAISIATPAGAQELGFRSFSLGGDSQFFTAFMDGIALGPWVGDLALSAGAPDPSGVTAVSGGGLVFVDVLGGSQGRVCRRLEQCTGTLYCQGGANVDVHSELDSEGCQGVIGGSGNSPVITTGVNPEDSGAGSLLLACTLREAIFREESAMPDCRHVPDGDGVESYGPPREFVLTTGRSESVALNACVPPASAVASGEPFACGTWATTGSGGLLVHTEVNEEQDPRVPIDLGAFSLLEDAPRTPACGDGLLDTGEECESPQDCGQGDVCSSVCVCIVPPVCGNGIPEDLEECDDQGASQTCDADCSFATCGDGVTNPVAGEQCETDLECGAEQSCASCLCVPTLGCGNGLLNSGEECDDGGVENGDGCDALCRAELPFRIRLANINLLHDVFEDNDILDRLSLAADELAALAPHVVTLQEVARVDGRDAQDILIEELSTRHGLEYTGLKYGEVSAGQALLSVWPVALGEVANLPTEKTAPLFPDRRWVARVEVRSPAGPLDVYPLHFCASCSNAERVVQTGEILDFVADTHASGHPAVIGADFNSHRGTSPDLLPVNDPSIDLLEAAGFAALFDGFDARCNPPLDRSGCTSGQDLRAPADTTQRRIDNVMVGPPARVSHIVEVGPTSTFADSVHADPNPECALIAPGDCETSADCAAGTFCDLDTGRCRSEPQACSDSEGCAPDAFCQVDLFVSDHQGVATVFELVRVPEPSQALHSGLALACLALAAFRRSRASRACTRGARVRPGGARARR